MDNFEREYKPAESLIPQGIKVVPTFKEGEGKVIGNAQMVQGNVVVIHKGQAEAYTLKNGHPLFVGDTLISGERSRLNAKMVDKSVFALAPVSKLVLDQQDSDAEKETADFHRQPFVRSSSIHCGQTKEVQVSSQNSNGCGGRPGFRLCRCRHPE